jgi:quercetin dioxygenase-like cupin family protein
MDAQVVPPLTFFSSAALVPTPFPQFAGLTARLLAGEHLMALFGHLEPGTTLPLHSHPHEQITYVLEGAASLQIGDDERELGPGDGALVPGGVTHGIVRVGPDGCAIIEVYTPVREEYLAAMRQAGTAGEAGH